MNKMLIEIFFPANGRSYEFKIPRDYRIFQVNNMLIDFFTVHSEEGYLPDENSVLCDRASGRILNGMLYVDMLEYMDNPRLMFI